MTAADLITVVALAAIIVLAFASLASAYVSSRRSDRYHGDALRAADRAGQAERARSDAEHEAARWRTVAGVHQLGEGRAAGEAATRIMPRVGRHIVRADQQLPHEPPVSQGGPLHIDPRFPAARSRLRHER